MADSTKPKSGWLNVLIDFGPLLVFFLAYRHFSPAKDTTGLGSVVAVTKSTAAFMVATVAALIVSKWRLGKISPMLWLSTVLIVGFGGLTIWLGDPDYIQMKPTAAYLLFATILFVGLAMGKPLLRTLLQSAMEGLDETGWRKLSRNWAVFFVFLAILNEVLRHFYNKGNGGFDTWLWWKVWGFMPLSFLFTFSQVPMLLRHGLIAEEKQEVESQAPHD